MQTLISNPRALEAIMQIQQSLQQLQNEAPGLFPGYAFAFLSKARYLNMIVSLSFFSCFCFY